MLKIVISFFVSASTIYLQLLLRNAMTAKKTRASREDAQGDALLDALVDNHATSHAKKTGRICGHKKKFK